MGMLEVALGLKRNLDRQRRSLQTQDFSALVDR